MSAKPHNDLLVILPSLRARLVSEHQVRLTQKFREGMELMVQYWGGPVTAIMHPDPRESTGNLDDVVVDRRDLPFGVEVIAFDSPQLLDALKHARVVQGGSHYLLHHVPRFCTEHGIVYVFVSEYSLKTRCQIIDAEVGNPVTRLRRYFWEWKEERRNRSSVSASAAVHCNGTPTFDAYSKLNANALLYFDSRVTPAMIVRRQDVASKADRLRSGAPIRLAFSGRLNRMKGADDLVPVAQHLRELGVPLSMEICGDGTLTATIQSQIDGERLGEAVRLRGVLDFKTGLLPLMRSDVDLFVCCHRQGDPSCTYLETFSCGVPVVGYANEALAGLVRRRAVGWTTPMNDPRALAAKIKELYEAPELLDEAARNAVDFAIEHNFESTFRQRMAHMSATLRRQQGAQPQPVGDDLSTRSVVDR